MTEAARPRRTRAQQAALELAQPAPSDAVRDVRAIGRRHNGDSRSALQEMAQTLGHRGGAVVETVSSERWFSFCQCGWVSTTRRTQVDATGALVHHINLAIKAWVRTGLPLSAARPAPEPDWLEIRRTTSHYAAWYDAQIMGCPENLPKDATGPEQAIG